MIILSKTLAAPAIAGIVKGLPESLVANENPGIVPVYVVEKVDEPIPMEWWQELHNHVLFGNIPDPEDVEPGTLLGWLKLEGQKMPEDTDIWTRGFKETCVKVLPGAFFDKPLQMTRFSAEKLDRSACTVLPTHRIVEAINHNFFDELTLTVNSKIYEAATRGFTFEVELTPSMKELVLDKEGNLQQFEMFSLRNGNQEKNFVWSEDCQLELDNIPTLPSVFDENAQPRGRLIISCAKPLI